jgi:hypothetical protein
VLRNQYAKITTVPFNFVTYTAHDFANTGHIDTGSQATTNAKAAEAERRLALNKLNLAMNAVGDLERRMGITTRWTSGNREFKSALAYMNNRRFIRCVEKLGYLVVQRLFELSKANLAGTCKYAVH